MSRLVSFDSTSSRNSYDENENLLQKVYKHMLVDNASTNRFSWGQKCVSFELSVVLIGGYTRQQESQEQQIASYTSENH